jgi:hypothetical protein
MKGGPKSTVNVYFTQIVLVHWRETRGTDAKCGDAIRWNIAIWPIEVIYDLQNGAAYGVLSITKYTMSLN